MIRLGSPTNPTKLDVSVRYLAAPEADYLTEGSIRRELGEAHLRVTRSRTDMIGAYLGLAWD
jgi:hypothetical protein